MTSSNPASSPEFPEQQPHHVPRHMAHKSEYSDSRDIMALHRKIDRIMICAEDLGMLANKAVFHSTIHDGDEIAVASEIITRAPNETYLRIVTNRYARTDYASDSGLVFASDSLIGLAAITRNITSRVGVIEIEGASPFESDNEEGIPPLITKNDEFEHVIIEFDTTPMVPYPKRATVMRDLPEDIATSASYAEHLDRTLAILTPATEDVRYPLEP